MESRCQGLEGQLAHLIDALNRESSGRPQYVLLTYPAGLLGLIPPMIFNYAGC